MWKMRPIKGIKSWPEASRSPKARDGGVKRAPRVPTSGILVEARSLGSDVAYNFQCVDVSTGGLRLARQHQGLPPFTRGSIVELTVIADGAVIKVLGKVAWRAVSGRLKEVGIKVIDPENRVAWEELVAELQTKTFAAVSDWE